MGSLIYLAPTKMGPAWSRYSGLTDFGVLPFDNYISEDDDDYISEGGDNYIRD